MICILLNTLLCTIAVLASGCSQKIQETVKEDFISLTSTQATTDHTVQSIEITVSSSESWTMETFFASYDRSRTWVGLDLGERHIITKVGWSPRKEHQKRVELALFEGATASVTLPGSAETTEYGSGTYTLRRAL